MSAPCVTGYERADRDDALRIQAALSEGMCPIIGCGGRLVHLGCDTPGHEDHFICQRLYDWAHSRTPLPADHPRAAYHLKMWAAYRPAEG